jgi:hypothetical protein
MTKQEILRLNDELKYAVMKTSNKDLTALVGKIPLLLIYVTSRRFKNGKKVILKIGKYFSLEGSNFYKAVVNKNLKKYLDNKYKKINKRIGEINEDIIKSIKNLSDYIKKNPKTNITNILMFILGAYLGSGGIDGDGGIPDLDLKIFGMGDHRSIFTHSIIAGVSIEVLILFFILAIDMIYDNLPKEHLEIWDLIHEKKDDFLFNFTTGVSAGLAYHFAIDATIDGSGIYKDLPFSAPIEVHQFIMGANSFLEGVDSYCRKYDLKKIKKVNFSFLEKFKINKLKGKYYGKEGI